MKITLHGAAGDVTGSAYLVETERSRLLVDFGMFQGGARIEAKNVLPGAIDPIHLDAVLLTHAHLDHCGRLPLLTKAGFHGPIHATAATIDLTRLILRDSAKVQAHDADRANRKREGTGEALLQPLYTAQDVEQVEPLFREVPYNQSFEVAEGISALYVEAGHMLGSASIKLTVNEQGREKEIVFSGDLGPRELAFVRDAEPFQRADLLFLESTYGDRDHRAPKETLAEFRSIITRAIHERAKILVPSFAIGRAQQILFHLDDLFCSGHLRPFPIYLDSPMAIEATAIYKRHPDLFDEDAVRLQDCRFAWGGEHLRSCATAEQSMALNDVPGPCLIVAGSGMCTGGRIVHHLRHNLSRPETVVMIVGYQGEGSLGRQLVDGAKEVRMFGAPVAVNAQIHTLNGFSAHAGQSELLRWFHGMASAKPQVILTHGEARGREPLAALLQERYHIKASLPWQGDSVQL